MRYQIIESAWPEKLAEAVRKAIAQGWTPIGGVSVCGNYYGTYTWAQAMVLNAELTDAKGVESSVGYGKRTEV